MFLSMIKIFENNFLQTIVNNIYNFRKIKITKSARSLDGYNTMYLTHHLKYRFKTEKKV